MFFLLSQENFTNEIISQTIGYLAGLLGIITCLPQLLKTLKSKKTENISLLSYFIFNFANLLWLIFGILVIITQNVSIINIAILKILWGLTIIIPYFISFLSINIIIGIKIYNIKKHGEKTKKYEH